MQQDMVLQQTSRFNDCQRIQVAKEVRGEEKVLKISVERFDDALGWYVAGSLVLPLQQLPLLQQTLNEMSCSDCPDCVQEKECRGKIISFPLLMQANADPKLAEA
jgi:hypothetical protein